MKQDPPSPQKIETEKAKATEGDPSVASSEKLERCSCGHDRDHYMVSQIPTYTAWGTFWITLLGVSATPIRLDFKCRVCKEVFDFIRDPEELKQFL